MKSYNRAYATIHNPILYSLAKSVIAIKGVSERRGGSGRGECRSANNLQDSGSAFPAFIDQKQKTL